jgi:hypothetical protein
MGRGGFRGGFRRPYGRLWGGPYRSVMGRCWRPFWWYPLWWRPLYWMPWTLLMGGVMYLLYDSMAYKLYEDDVGRIERETGTPVRDLSEVDLVAAMKRLGIQRLEVTPNDRTVISQSAQPIPDLNQKDLLAAMKRLGIQRLELPPEDTAATSSSPKRVVSYCSSCGNALSSDAVYCEQCGRKIE